MTLPARTPARRRERVGRAGWRAGQGRRAVTIRPGQTKRWTRSPAAPGGAVDTSTLPSPALPCPALALPCPARPWPCHHTPRLTSHDAPRAKRCHHQILPGQQPSRLIDIKCNKSLLAERGKRSWWIRWRLEAQCVCVPSLFTIHSS